MHPNVVVITTKMILILCFEKLYIRMMGFFTVLLEEISINSIYGDTNMSYR